MPRNTMLGLNNGTNFLQIKYNQKSYCRGHWHAALGGIRRNVIVVCFWVVSSFGQPYSFETVACLRLESDGNFLPLKCLVTLQHRASKT